MGGGLMQLVAYGAQDIYLTGNPQITFFKVVYRRHTNFSMEEINQTENGSVTLGATATPSASYTISRNGDLVHKMYLQMDISALTTANNSATAAAIFHNLINEVECEIGGQKIDRHYGHWLETWTNLTVQNDRGLRTPHITAASVGSGIPIYEIFSNNVGAGGMGLSLYDKMTGNAAGLTTMTFATTELDYENIHIPLQFWFNRNPGLALPLIALQYHEVKIKVSFNSLETATGCDSTDVTAFPSGVKLFAQYIYLDTDERRRFAQVSHEYLIEQLQFQTEPASDNITLNFNHPVKELIWAGVGSAASNHINAPITSGTSWQMKLNGHDRFSSRPIEYFTKQQVYDYHTGFGGMGAQGLDSIAVYSFALKPEEHQPSGTCNFSRIDTAQLIQTSSTSLDVPLNVYAVNYNVLRIMSGMGGLAYSN